MLDIKTRYLINRSNDIGLAKIFPRSERPCGTHDCSRRFDKATVIVKSVEGVVDFFIINPGSWDNFCRLYPVKFRTIKL